MKEFGNIFKCNLVFLQTKIRSVYAVVFSLRVWTLANRKILMSMNFCAGKDLDRKENKQMDPSSNWAPPLSQAEAVLSWTCYEKSKKTQLCLEWLKVRGRGQPTTRWMYIIKDIINKPLRILKTHREKTPSILPLIMIIIVHFSRNYGCKWNRCFINQLGKYRFIST